MDQKTILNHIEDLIFKDEATKDFEFFNGKLSVSIASLNGGNQLEIERRMRDVTGTNAEILHYYQLWILTYTVRLYNGQKPENIETWFDFIKNKPTIILDVLIKTQGDFEKELREGLNNKEVIENFSNPTSTAPESV